MQFALGRQLYPELTEVPAAGFKQILRRLALVRGVLVQPLFQLLLILSTRRPPSRVLPN
jgi:hypothetical protein